MNLAQTQRQFQRALLSDDRAIESQIREAPGLAPRERLDVYREAYAVRLADALRDNFPKLHFILGDDLFASMACAYVETHPSRTRSIRWLGGTLADFLRDTAPFSAQPALAELALFEWLLRKAFDAADAPAFSKAALGATAPDQWGDLPLRFHPSVERMSLAWNTVAIWRAADADQSEESAVAPPRPERASTPVPWLLWRQDLRTFFRSLDARESAALDIALRGARFAEVCEALTAHMNEAEIPLYAATLLVGWADSGLLVADGG